MKYMKEFREIHQVKESREIHYADVQFYSITISFWIR